MSTAPAHPGDHSRIDLSDELEVGFWCFKLECTRAQLLAAAREVGAIAGDIRRHLGK